MFQLVFGLVQDNSHARWWNDVPRIIFSLLERIVTTLIPYVYNILVEIANNEIISGNVVRALYSRVQMILGVIMIFKLSVSVIQYIINPDTLSDKSNGMGNVIVKIIIMLVLLTSIVPLNIPPDKAPKGSYNYYLSQHGLLFGTMYSFQARILTNDVLGRLILGEKDSIGQDDPKNGPKMRERYGNELSIAILKTVIRKNPVCPANKIKPGQEDTYAKYDNNTFTPNDLLDAMYEVYCDFTRADEPDDRYAFTYFPIVGGVIGVFVLLALVSYCVDVAIRAIKLAILRLIAPIPIISYMDPKSSEKGMFSNWLNTVVKTYLDLFVRLSIIYFVILLVQQILGGGVTAFDFSTPTGAFATLFIIVGLFFFAKQAPEFIYQALGIEYKKGKGIFSGLGKLASLGGALGGAIGSAATNYRAAKDELTPKDGSFMNKFKPFASALAGGASGFATGAKAAAGADDHHFKAARDAMDKRNARRASHSTGFGRAKDSLYGMFTGTSLANRDQDMLEANKEAADKLKSYKSLLQDEAKKNGNLGFTKSEISTTDGKSGKRAFNYSKLMAAMNAKDSKGNFKYGGLEYNVRDFDENVMNEILDDQAIRYQAGDTREGAKSYTDNGKITNARIELNYKLEQADLGSSITAGDVRYEDLGKAIGDASEVVAKQTADMEHVKHRANYTANKNK